MALDPNIVVAIVVGILVVGILMTFCYHFCLSDSGATSMIVKKRQQHLQNMQRLYMQQQQQQQMAVQHGGGGGGGGNGSMLQPQPRHIGLGGGPAARPDNEPEPDNRDNESAGSSTSQHFYPEAGAAGMVKTTSTPALLPNGQITLGLGIASTSTPAKPAHSRQDSNGDNLVADVITAAAMQDGDDDIDTRATMAAGAIPETDETDGAGSASPREAEDYDMNTSPVSIPAPVVIATTSAGDHDSDSDSDSDGDGVDGTGNSTAARAIPETDETDGAGSASPREAEDYDMNTSPVSSPAPVVIATTSAGDHDSDSDSDGDGDDVVAQPLAHVQKQPAPAKSTQIATYGKQSSSLTTTEVHLAFRVAVEALMKKALLAGKNPQRSALALDYLNEQYLKALPNDQDRAALLQCCRAAIDGPGRWELGCRAQRASDYTVFGSFFKKIIRDSAGTPTADVHPTSRASPDLVATPFTSHHRVTMHTNRNVAGFPLSPQMTKVDRMHMERVVTSALMGAAQAHRINGIYRSLTPGHPQHLTPEEHRGLVNTGAMFGATIRESEDQEGCTSDWPYGRGCFISVDGSMAIWVGLAEHIQVRVSGVVASPMEVYRKTTATLALLAQSNMIKYQYLADFGWITSNPTHVGTGFSALNVTVATKAAPETMRLVEQTVEQQRLKIIISSDDASGHKEWKLGIRLSFGVDEVALLTSIAAAANVFDAGEVKSTTPEVALTALQSDRKTKAPPARRFPPAEEVDEFPVQATPAVTPAVTAAAAPRLRAALPGDSVEVSSIYGVDGAANPLAAVVPLQPDAGLVNLDDLDSMFAAAEAEVVTVRQPLPGAGASNLYSVASATLLSPSEGSSVAMSAPPANRFGRKPAAAAAATPNAAPKKARKPWAPPVQDSGGLAGASPFAVVQFKRPAPREQAPAGAPLDAACSFLGSCQCKNCR